MRGTAVAAQTGAVVLGPLALALAPPANGAMQVIPIGRADAVTYARDHGAMLLGRGAVAGSIIVSGERTRLLGNPVSTGMVILSATPGGCGAAAAEATS